MASPTNEPALTNEVIPSEPEGALVGLRRTVAIAAVLAAIALAVIDVALLNVALPTISGAMHVTAATSVRVITAYQMGLVIALLPSAALGESLGYRRVFTLGVALFTGASALCAFSPSLPWLIAACFLQGLGGAAIMALSVALLRFIVLQRQLGAAMGWNSLTVALSYAAGPPVGALILSRAGWPWLFAINVPFGIAIVFACRALPRVAASGHRLDVLSVALNGWGFVALVVGAELLPTKTVLGFVLLVSAAISLMALVRRETRSVAPLIPLDLLRVLAIRIAVIASVSCFAGQMMGLVALPFYLQHGLGQSALQTGLYLTPWPLGIAVAAPIAGRLVNRVSTVKLCTAGSLCLSTGLVCAAFYPLQGRPWMMAIFALLCGVGAAIFQVPIIAACFFRRRASEAGRLGGCRLPHG